MPHEKFGLRENMERQFAHVRAVHESDLADGFGLTSVPASLHKKYGPAMKDFGWQYLFPSVTRCVHPIAGYVCRHHLHHSSYSRRLRQAVLATGITKRVTAHTFRHAFATELLRSGAISGRFRKFLGIATFERQKSTRMSLAIDVLEPSALLIVCQVLDGALLTRLRGVKPGIGGAVNVRFCLRPDSGNQPPPQPWSNGQNRPFYARENDHRAGRRFVGLGNVRSRSQTSEP